VSASPFPLGHNRSRILYLSRKHTFLSSLDVNFMVRYTFCRRAFAASRWKVFLSALIKNDLSLLSLPPDKGQREPGPHPPTEDPFFFPPLPLNREEGSFFSSFQKKNPPTPPPQNPPPPLFTLLRVERFFFLLIRHERAATNHDALKAFPQNNFPFPFFPRRSGDGQTPPSALSSRALFCTRREMERCLHLITCLPR